MAETKLTFDYEGFEGVALELKKWPDKLKREKINNVLRWAAKPMLEGVRREAPIEKHSRTITRSTKSKTNSKNYNYDPGNLAESIKIITGKKGLSKINPTVYIGPEVGLKAKHDGYYGFFVTSGIAGNLRTAPNDFINRGGKPFESGVEARIEEAILRMLKREAKKQGFKVV
jgi:hypothetical protein